jgi:3-methyladenine DNA glycosylase AlkD
MSYSILRVAKVKGSVNTRGLQKHNQRENENYNNKDINHEETYRNYDLINAQNIDYQQVIDETIDANYAGNRKIRSDAIRHVDGLITSDKEFFEDMDDSEIKSFFKDSLEFLENEYGKENMLYATVHLDERVPHMHFGFVPLTDDGRLSAKERLGNKKALTELQDRFNVHMNDRGHDMERGTSKQVTEHEHRQMDQYKKDTAFHQQELEGVKSELQKAKTDLQDEIEYIRSAGSFDYEDERKGLFGGREEAGRKIVSADEFERLKKTISSAERIIDDYETLKNQDLYKENQKLLKDNAFQNRRAQEWQNKALEYDGENDRLERENRSLREDLSLSEEFQNSAVALYHTARKHFPGFEKGFNQLKDKFLNDHKFERIGQFMDVVQDNVYKADRKREKRRTDDLEM